MNTTNIERIGMRAEFITWVGNITIVIKRGLQVHRNNHKTKLDSYKKADRSRHRRWREELEPRLKEFRYTLHLLKRSPLSVAGLLLVVSIIILAIAAPWIAPYGPEERNWHATKLPPSAEHLFGTDSMGGDVFSRVLWGARLDVGLAIMVVTVDLLAGVIVGGISGYIGGKWDEILMRVTDIFLAFPGMILSMAVCIVLGKSLTSIMIGLMIVWWPSYARLIRGQILAERERLYVVAARAAGASNRRIVFQHLVPNSIYPLLVAATLDIGNVILSAAGLSFIGFGAQAGVAEWGLMISDGRAYGFLQGSWWMVVFPGLAILITALAFNLLGDGLRDVLDPRLRR